MTSPPSSTTARWSFNFRLGGGLGAVDWNALPRSLLSVGALRSRTGQLSLQPPGLCVHWKRSLGEGEGYHSRSQSVELHSDSGSIYGIAFPRLPGKCFPFFFFLTYDCPRKFAWFLLSIKKWLGTTRHPNPNVYSLPSSSNMRACQPARKKIWLL